ncbi:hypothetical protein EGT49_07130 [Companilactobacillus suantsaicola]|uniref:Uncharacterized protein n=1 Tax=Companilactobacillus suantsaicola TaxID=2487723 RepID=A0A4Z0JMJ3_9LACO|nr:hypothetical protein EGT49_07130 [Companilactobacillus suantsaicola]
MFQYFNSLKIEEDLTRIAVKYGNLVRSFFAVINFILNKRNLMTRHNTCDNSEKSHLFLRNGKQINDSSVIQPGTKNSIGLRCEIIVSALAVLTLVWLVS